MEAGKTAAEVVKKPSPCDVEALKKCLEENKGDYIKCQSQIEAFKSSCSLKKPSPVTAGNLLNFMCSVKHVLYRLPII
ncbi:hypothetical protein FCM35_KLT20199 [Carex littledalei]|uniref:Uncharacterized protein n=1 Tax=Carex littledalei TaxID=544730 RepID=A0A833RCJ7_9POAL|nr:hypothetical protein FCM35_KLT20199 [Carex littledalei]